MNALIRSLVTCLLALSGATAAELSAQPSLPVVPGGHGFAMATRAAYGGARAPAVIRVTNTLASGAGSFREAVLATGPRVVVFETSGTIDIGEDGINIVEPYLTIAGQTAPSPGITIKGGGLNVYAHDVLISHLRIRPGDGGKVLPQTAGHDSALMYVAFGREPSNIVWDHCSISWAGGKVADLLAAGTKNTVTLSFWRSILSEALFHSKNVIIDKGQPSSLGMLLTGNTGGGADVSVIGNLFAHNSDRNPEVHEGVRLQFLNNVIYDWGIDSQAQGGNNYEWATFFYAPVPAGPIKATIQGNVYIAGPGPHPTVPLYAVGVWVLPPGSQIYMSDNIRDQRLQQVREYFQNRRMFDPRVFTSPVPLDGVTVLPASSVKSQVIATAGARPADRDAVDRRIVNQVQTYTGKVIRSQNEVGGWPDLAVNIRRLTVPANPHQATRSGYTNLEAWLHAFSAEVEGSTTKGSP